MHRLLGTLAVLVMMLAFCGAAVATEYHVGSGQTYATVNDLLLVVTLGDNDIVWVHPGTYPNFWVKAGGGSSEAAAVQIRAWDPNNKPIFDAAGANNCAQFEDPNSVYGLVGNASGLTRGVYGHSLSDTGRGVEGKAENASGVNYGLYGWSTSTAGTGVYGFGTAATGTTYGVYGRVNSADGYAGYFTDGQKF